LDSDATSIAGNKIGTDAFGTAALGNGGVGIHLVSSAISTAHSNYTTIGGIAPGARNIISDNLVGVSMGNNVSNTLMQGNYIGTDVTGTSALGNLQGGITLGGLVANTTIGGTTAAARNVISGNGLTGFFSNLAVGFPAITLFETGGANNLVEGNYIGTDASGLVAMPNGYGIVVGNSTGPTIGGAVAGAGNLISGNNSFGIVLGNSVCTTIQGNYIGTDATGMAALGNGYLGVLDRFASNNTIGGTTAAEANVISGNGALYGGYGYGVQLSGTGDLLEGNHIGTNVLGTAPIPNYNDGVFVNDPNNTVGGIAAGVGNIISGNYGAGVHIRNTTGIVVQGNYIGTNAAGVALGNNADGVSIDNGATNNTIGGAAAGNVIAFNARDGVRVLGATTTGNTISRNSIYSNSALGIDLGVDGVTLNDSAGHVGPNNFQDFPTLTAAGVLGSNTLVLGSLKGTANTAYSVEFFANTTPDPSGYGQGQTFLGARTLVTDGTGTANFTVTDLPLVPAGEVWITSTATDASGNTSEFSDAVKQAVTILAFHPPSPTEGAGTGSLTVANFIGGDPNANISDFTATVTWGDGSIDTLTSAGGGIVQNSDGSFSVIGSHTYAEEGIGLPFSVQIADKGGASTATSATINVADAPLAGQAVTFRPTTGQLYSGRIASFTDSNPSAPASDFSATIAWGDGFTSMGTIQANPARGFDVRGSHGYAADGSEPVTVQILDQGGSPVTVLSVAQVSGVATAFQVSAPASTTAGVPVTVTVTALDTAGNVSLNYGGTVHFTSSDPQATLPADTTFTATDAGVHTFVGAVTLKTAGSQTVTSTDTAMHTIQGASGPVSVSPAAAQSLTLTGFPSSTTAGTSGNVTVTAYDAYGNVATGYRGTVHFTSSDPQAAVPSNYTFTPTDNGSHSFSAILKTAGPQTIAATDTVTAGITGTTGTSTVNPAAFNHFGLATPATTTAGMAFSMTVTAQDAYNNTVTTYTNTVHFRSSDAKAVLPANYTFTAGDHGVHPFSITLKTSGNQTVTVIDTNLNLTTTSSAIAVSPAAASKVVIGMPSSVKAGVAVSVVVTLVDAYGNVVTGYTGTLHFTSSDPRASLPPDYKFTAADAGKHTFLVTFRTRGKQTLTTTDTTNSSVTGSAQIQVS
jgi:hypothetical protein